MLQNQDALQNTVIAENDYRILAPKLMTDPNGNRSAVAFDSLGMVVASAIKGKASENFGDLLEDFDPDPSLATLQAFIADPNNTAKAQLLGKATTRIVYDLDRYQRCGQPPFAATLARETHFHDQGGAQSKIQVSFSYSDGFGREIQKKIQAEPGNAPQRGSAVTLNTGDTQPGALQLNANNKPVQAPTESRWVGNGRTVFNNKGKPVKQYEPFFSSTHLYEPEQDLTDTGVSPTLFYDPLGRVVATLHPNHTWEKVLFDPWRQETWDSNDTIGIIDPNGQFQALTPDADPDVGAYFRRIPQADYLPTWYGLRTDPAHAAEFAQQVTTTELRTAETAAAQQTQIHAATPSVAHADALGRTFLTVAHNKHNYNDSPTNEPPIEEFHATRVNLDIEGNQREVEDANRRIVMRYHYDMLGNRIHQASMEAGERWLLNDVSGKPIRTWDSRGFLRRMTYDLLRRPIGLYVTENGTERLAEQTLYGESLGSANNHRTRVYQVKDAAGIVTSLAYDFKGNLLQSQRDLLSDYKTAVDWQQNHNPNDGRFTNSTQYDALNRPLTVTAPDGSVYRPTFNEANLLDKVDVNLRGEQVNGSPVWTAFVTNIDYNAKGQRTLIQYGNQVNTAYDYDELTFRLKRLSTTRNDSQNNLASQLFTDTRILQNLSYVYDPAGNITQIHDAALLTLQRNGETIAPLCRYNYDALYRLIEAQGREHIGQNEFQALAANLNLRDRPFVGAALTNDLQALRNYTQRYRYDKVGNFQSFGHHTANHGWTRNYEYQETSLLQSGLTSNRLSRTIVSDNPASNENYRYQDSQGRDVHGCMTAINSMALTWDFEDQLQQADLGGGGTAYYVYDAGGQRIRKVIERQNGSRQKERIYLGGYEIYREYNPSISSGQAVTLERTTLHVMDDKQRIALVETLTIENSLSLGERARVRARYQLGNHLDSASLELDEAGQLISYEEYHPYGTTAFQATRSGAEVSTKRYRYTGMERDGETGFSYHGARYYLPWLGRWLSADPNGIKSGINLYLFVKNAPLALVDLNGMTPQSNDKRVHQVGQLSAQRDRITADLTEVERKIHKASETAMNMRAHVLATNPGYFSDDAKAMRSAEGYVNKLQRQREALGKQLRNIEVGIERLKKEILKTPGEQGLKSYADAVEAEGNKAAADEIREELIEGKDKLKSKFDELEEAEKIKDSGKKGSGNSGSGGASGSSSGHPTGSSGPSKPGVNGSKSGTKEVLRKTEKEAVEKAGKRLGRGLLHSIPLIGVPFAIPDIIDAISEEKYGRAGLLTVGIFIDPVDWAVTAADAGEAVLIGTTVSEAERKRIAAEKHASPAPQVWRENEPPPPNLFKDRRVDSP